MKGDILPAVTTSKPPGSAGRKLLAGYTHTLEAITESDDETEEAWNDWICALDIDVAVLVSEAWLEAEHELLEGDDEAWVEAWLARVVSKVEYGLEQLRPRAADVGGESTLPEF